MFTVHADCAVFAVQLADKQAFELLHLRVQLCDLLCKRVFLLLKLQILVDLRDLRCAERCRRQIPPVNAFPSLQTLQNEIAAFRIVRWLVLLYMLVPERIFQRDQLRLIGIVPVQMPDDDLILIVSIQAAEVDPVQIHD